MSGIANKVASVIEFAALVLLTWIGFCLDFDLETLENNAILQTVVGWVKNWSAYLVLSLSVIIAIVRFTKWWLRPKSSEELVLDRLITEELEKFRKTCFPELPSDVPIDHNRVTIFKHVPFCWRVNPFRNFGAAQGVMRWPWAGWLIAINRSGHVTQAFTTAFLAPDQAINAEGVAGQAWRRGMLRVGIGKERLPNLNQYRHYGLFEYLKLRIIKIFRSDAAAVKEFAKVQEDVKEYAELTHTSTLMVWNRLKDRKTCPTSIVGILIPDLNGVPWGVLAMDSCNDVECIDTNDRRFRTALTKLTNNLRRFGVFDN